MWSLPKEMYAEISRWLPNDYAGMLMRTMARDVIIKDVRNDCTYANGLLHSFNDEPAVVYDRGARWYANSKNTSRRWSCKRKYYLHGKLHRIDGPAVIHANGDTKYYLHGKLHRVNGPAIIHANGDTEYYLHGNHHREDGPAIVCTDGYTAWFLNGNHHREDGPAVIYRDGMTEYWVNNMEID